MVHLRCPQCATVIDVAEGVTPVCPTCGYGSTPAPPGGPPPPPPGGPPPPYGAPTYTPPPGGNPPPYGYPQPYPPTYAPGQPPSPGHAAAGPTSGKAIGSLVAGIVGLFLVAFGLILGAVAVGLGVAAQREIDASGGRLTGKGFATAGIVLGVISMVIGAFTFLMVFNRFWVSEWLSAG